MWCDVERQIVGHTGVSVAYVFTETLKWLEAICFSSSKKLRDWTTVYILNLPFNTNFRKATFYVTTLRRWPDVPQKWLKAKDINGSSIFRLEESRPHEFHMKSAGHFLSCWLRFMNDKMGNNYIFYLLTMMNPFVYILYNLPYIYQEVISYWKMWHL